MSLPLDLVCAVDLGGTNLRAANIDRDGRIHARFAQPTPETESAGKITFAICALIKQCEEQALKREARLGGVSVVVPGSVHAETGVIVNAPNIPALVGYKLGEALQKELERTVLLQNDANAAAAGELWQGAARGCRTMICLTLGTGVGSGIILDGELWRGADGTAGEIGHTSVEPFGHVQCKCGNTGCLEVHASATALVRMAREELTVHPASKLSSIASHDLTGEAISHAATDGDAFALELFRRLGVYLGVAMANVINALNPEMIVLGGGLSAAFDLFAPHAQAEVLKRAFPVPARRCRIVRAQCGGDAGLFGAAWLAFEAP